MSDLDHAAVSARLTGPERLMAAVAKAWHLTEEERAALFDGSDQRDRIRVLWIIHDLLADMLPAEIEARWIRASTSLLEGQSPLERMTQKHIAGMIAVRNVVLRTMANR